MRKSRNSVNGSDTQNKDQEVVTKPNGKPANSSNNRNGSPKGRPTKFRGFNDPSWYASSPQLMKDAASLAFSNFQGMTMHDTGRGGKDFNPETVCTIDYVPTFGKAKSATDALNIAVRNIYSYVRHANSGHTNYDPADLGIYIMAVTEVFGLIAHLDRIYGISRVYSVKNRILPNQLLTALGVSATDVLANQARLRYEINRLKLKIASLCIPKGMSLVERRLWMNTFTFKDADTDKSSLYIFRPTGYYKFYPTQLSSGGSLQYITWPGTSLTVTQLIATTEQVIDAVLEDEDMNIMSGDILKAYGESGLINVSLTPEDLYNIPVYQSEVLPQIHNLIIIGPSRNGTDDLISEHLTGVTGYVGANKICLQQKNGILYNNLFYGHFSGSSMVADGATTRFWPAIPMGKRLLDEPMDAPEASDVMVATRLHPTVIIPDIIPGTSPLELGKFGTEIVVALHFFSASTATFGAAYVFLSSTIATVASGGVETHFIDQLTPHLEQFDMHPIFYIVSGNMNVGTDSVYNTDFAFNAILGDLYNFTLVSESELNKTHETAVISEMSINGSLFDAK